jgi:hypothetical protein
MTNAFKTAEGADAWTPSVVKELTKIGPKHAFAMEQVDFWEIPSKAPILMLQVEHSRKKETNEMKTRLVVNGAQEPYKQDEDNYAPTALQKGGQLLFALAAQERRPMRGIDITCAFASESLTAEDGDIYVKYPDVLVKYFSGLLNQQREEQKEILAAEAKAKKVTEEISKSASFSLDVAVDDQDQAKNATESDSLGDSSEDAQSKRRRQAKDTFAKHRSNHWKARKVEKAKQRVRSASSSNRQGYYAKLRKSLYGLRRAAKLFNRGLRQLLKDNGYESCPADTHVYFSQGIWYGVDLVQHPCR